MGKSLSEEIKDGVQINWLLFFNMERRSSHPTLFTLVIKTTFSSQGLAAGRNKVNPMLQVLWELRGLHLEAGKHRIIVIYCHRVKDSSLQLLATILPFFYTGAARSCLDCCVSHFACSTSRHTPACLFWTRTFAPGKKLCHPK